MTGHPLRSPRHRGIAASIAVTSLLTLASCSSGSSPGTSSATTTQSQAQGSSDHPSATTQRGATTSPAGSVTSATGLRTPATLPDGNFPDVFDPARDGSLEDVRVETPSVAHADEPLAMVARPGHPGQLFLAERAGRVRLVTVDPRTRALTIARAPLADITSIVETDGEKGLLGLAFDPSGKTLYLSYNVANGDSHIDRAPITDTGSRPRIGKRTNLLIVDQMGTNFHKGGNVAVDADGLLYAGFGDGGPQDDENQHAQNPKLLLGKILRIDPSHPSGDKPYGIPPGNPYATNGRGRPEIWLTGVRNPWRFSIDPANGDLWIGDVGQNAVEEIDRLPGGPVANGANLGWSGFEGTRAFRTGRVKGPSVPPIFEISHDDGVCSITGGVVYRGSRIPALRGVYVYSDMCRSGVHAIRATTPRDGIGHVTDERLLSGTQDVGQIISFATDDKGEVYTLSLDGTIHRLDSTD